MQIQDLAKIYGSKRDEELLELATRSDQLTSEAGIALRSEMGRRRIAVAELLKPTDEEHQASNLRHSPSSNSKGISTFVTDVLRLYHSHFWTFVEVTSPAVLIGYFAVFLARQQGRGILQHLSQEDLLRRSTFIEIWMIHLAGYFLSWMALCVSFGAICLAVRAIQEGKVPQVSNLYARVRNWNVSFVRVSLLLFVLCLVAMGVSGFLFTGLLWLEARFHVHWTGLTSIVSALICSGLPLLVLSRFGLAMPAVILDNCTVGQAMFRSDELTQGKWLELAALLSKSLVGGYVAGKSPFWLASIVLSDAMLPWWFPWVLTAASISAVTIVEPTMFIGFALLYVRQSAVSTCTQALAPQTI